MVSGVLPVGITQNERFLSRDTVLLGVRCVCVCVRIHLSATACRLGSDSVAKQTTVITL
jgi:hypothetical protein